MFYNLPGAGAPGLSYCNCTYPFQDVHSETMTKWIVVIIALLATPAAFADQADVIVSHGIAMHGQPKYGPDFAHFGYVNPDAPTGGELRLANQGTFDSFHAYIPKGNSASTGSVETLMISSADEAFSEYGLIAESLEYPQDRSWVIFNLRPEARWHDGVPISAEDVVWSFETLTTMGPPAYRFYYGGVESAQVLGERRVKFTFSEKGNRELPLIVGQLPILPKHYWATRNFEKTTLDPPLGSGPYRIAEFEAGRYYVQERVDDYWGRDLAGEGGHQQLRSHPGGLLPGRHRHSPGAQVG